MTDKSKKDINISDKQIIDPCDNCNVEPPAMKFKCPTCKNKGDIRMNDKMRNDYRNTISSLQQELQAEKGNSKHLEDCLNQALKDFEAEQKKVKELEEELQTGKDNQAYAIELEKDIEKYKQALEEIEEVVKHYFSLDPLEISNRHIFEVNMERIQESIQNTGI